MDTTRPISAHWTITRRARHDDQAARPVADATFDTATLSLHARSVVVTTASNEARAGCIVRFHTQCGVEPIRYAVWLPTSSRTFQVARLATHLAVHVVEDNSSTIEVRPTALGDLDADWL